MKKAITTQITTALQVAITELGLTVGTPVTLCRPTNLVFGDYVSSVALSLFAAQKINSGQSTWKTPSHLAEDIAKIADKKLQQLLPQIIKSVSVAGPGFLNFALQSDYLVSKMVEILKQATSDQLPYKNGKIAIVEYSSPNIAKPFTIGHLRSTIIGDAVAGLLEATGWEVWRDNHLGDWGTQFGKQIYALMYLGEGSLEKNIARINASPQPVKELVSLYVEFHQKATEDPQLDIAGREWFAKLEQGDPQARQLWQQCVDWSWQAFQQIYDQLNIHFADRFDQGRGLGEAFFENKMEAVIDELQEKLGEKPGDTPAKWSATGVYRQSESAWLVFFPQEEFPPLMILKDDGSSLYATRDLATDRYRLFGLKPRPDLIVNEVGAEQALYFRQLYKVEELLGWVKPGQRVHVKHGLYRFKDKKMSTRKGDVIWLEDVLEEAKKRAVALSKVDETNEGVIVQSISTKHSYAAQQKSLPASSLWNNASKIAIAALKWNDLKRGASLDVLFDWDEVLNMQGNSGPYLLYSVVRAAHVLKAVTTELKITTESLIDTVISQEGLTATTWTDSEIFLLRLLNQYDEVLANAAENYAPHLLCTYLFDLAQAFNTWYVQQKIVVWQTESAKSAISDLVPSALPRLLLTAAIAQVLESGLGVLGIQTVEEM